MVDGPAPASASARVLAGHSLAVFGLAVLSQAFSTYAGSLVVGFGFAGSLSSELLGARVITAATARAPHDDTGMLYSVLAFATRLVTVVLVGPIFGLLVPLFGYRGEDPRRPGPAFRFLLGAPLALHLAAIAGLWLWRRHERT
jgi:hypothetical protein